MRPATLGLSLLFALFALFAPLRADADAFVPGVEADARILRAFRQAEPDDWRTNPEIAKRNYGNCDSIALIKAAMATFGDAQVFSSVTSTLEDGRLRPGIPSSNDGRTYSVTLRDGRLVSVTREEVEIAVHDRGVNSGFHAGADEPSRVVTFEANFLYAVMAKHMTLPDAKAIALFARVDDYRNALRQLSDGVNVEDDAGRAQLAPLLGMTLAKAPRDTAPPGPHIVAMAKHVVFAFGDRGDNNGQDASIAEIVAIHSSFFTQWRGKNKHPDRYTIVTRG